MRTSLSPINSINAAAARASLRSTVIERLLALTARKPGETPFQKGGPHRRASSPSGRSTLTTSAPRWASTSAANGPARFCPNSTTLIPVSGSIGRARGSAEDRPRDHHPVHLGRTFADATDARLAVPAFERELLGDAVASVDPDGGVDHPPEHLARMELRDGSLHAGVLAAVGLPRPLPDKPAGRPQLHLRVRKHPLDGLALAQGGAER